jgi:hypothetical protein
MSGENNPLRQLAAAWEAATAVVTEWAEQTAAITSEAFHKLSSDPAIRAVLESWRTTLVWGQRDCECVCARSHPDDMGICDKRAVITRRLPTHLGGAVDVPLCAPCAVAQGVAEMPRLPCMMGTVASGGSPGWEADGRAARHNPGIPIDTFRWPAMVWQSNRCWARPPRALKAWASARPEYA